MAIYSVGINGIGFMVPITDNYPSKFLQEKINISVLCMLLRTITKLLTLFYRRARPHDLWWMVDINKLDFEYYLPIFCNALCEAKFPFDIIARDGTLEMLEAAKDRVLGVLPEVVMGIKKALNTNVPKVIMNACAVIQKLTTLTPLVSLSLIK